MAFQPKTHKQSGKLTSFWLFVERDGRDIFRRLHGRAYTNSDLRLMGDIYQGIGPERKEYYRLEAIRLNRLDPVMNVTIRSDDSNKLATYFENKKMIAMEPVHIPVHSGPAPVWLGSTHSRPGKDEPMEHALLREYLDNNFVPAIIARCQNSVFLPTPMPKYARYNYDRVTMKTIWVSDDSKAREFPESYINSGARREEMAEQFDEPCVPMDAEEKKNAINRIRKIWPTADDEEIEAMFK
ncbi:unnamed protein product, partial [Mesorhabditis belari]|uniref:Uncharacterized protein n=1 Tax=Mesorhabditis belari TaxID=2138241 RepID=A0AAF3ECN1_9BILA